jgi:flavorubredoxin
MESSYVVQPGVHVLPAFIPVPSLGLLPANAFLVEAEQPYLVDTGILADGDAFVAAVAEILDPADLRWIFLTHTDPDHIGALTPLLERAPDTRVLTTFIALAKLQLGLRPIPPSRVRLANPGEHIHIGDRTLSVMRPPVFDAPETTMVYDSRLDALFSSDSFGGPLAAPTEVANQLPADQLEQSQLLWAAVDAPWIHHIDRARFAARLGEITDLDPAWIFSAHLPPARRMAHALCRNLGRAPDAAPFLAPDQRAFEAMVRDLASPAAPSSPPT